MSAVLRDIAETIAHGGAQGNQFGEGARNPQYIEKARTTLFRFSLDSLETLKQEKHSITVAYRTLGTRSRDIEAPFTGRKAPGFGMSGPDSRGRSRLSHENKGFSPV
jgi:hypothetical protein